MLTNVGVDLLWILCIFLCIVIKAKHLQMKYIFAFFFNSAAGAILPLFHGWYTLGREMKSSNSCLFLGSIFISTEITVGIIRLKS